MNSTKHTPLPWNVAKDMMGIGNMPVAGVSNAENRCVANCGSGGDANAALIVRAVNNHAALVEALGSIMEWWGRQFYGKPEELPAELAAAGMNALAAARGE